MASKSGIHAWWNYINLKEKNSLANSRFNARDLCDLSYNHCDVRPSSLSMISQLFSGAMMFGAFFIATDPVTASITPRGKLVFGSLVGLLVYLIRYFGNYPDGVAFAILLSNICVPLIDYYTRPRVAGHFAKGRK